MISSKAPSAILTLQTRSATAIVLNIKPPTRIFVIRRTIKIALISANVIPTTRNGMPSTAPSTAVVPVATACPTSFSTLPVVGPLGVYFALIIKLPIPDAMSDRMAKIMPVIDAL